MTTKKKKKMKNAKIKYRCQMCGKLGSPNSMIHKDCALEYVKCSLGYGVFKFKSPLEWGE